MTDDDHNRIEEKLDRILKVLHGDDGADMGIVQKVNMLWVLVFKWPLYLASIVVGGVVTVLLQKLAKWP